ncbi:MAG: hypothetical protein NUW08_01550 [Candidatus Uhrbacteria bacterium]|nr:hypothetical protein [Candidatus Uhrbacteria bacterium]
MSDGGFLGAPQPEQVSQPAAPEAPETETPQESAEMDEVALAEREALKEMETAARETEKDNFLEIAQEAAPTSTVTPATQAAPAQEAAPPVEKDQVTQEVEKILEDGLGEYIPDMPDEAREKFIKKGGEVAGEVSGMVRSMNVKVKRVLDLIKAWLLTIPGVNRYFIEQEAKIKTDRIVDLVEAHRQERSSEIPRA